MSRETPARDDSRWQHVSDVPETRLERAQLGPGLIQELFPVVTYTQTWELYDDAGHQHVITEHNVAARARTEMPPL